MKLHLNKKQSITGFGDDTPDSVYKAFKGQYSSADTGGNLPPHLEIFYADYTYEDYNGDCYVLGYDKQEKKWFEVYGSHCSCYGLEDQWDKEYYDSKEQLLKVIELRLQRRGRYADSSDEFIEWLNS